VAKLSRFFKVSVVQLGALVLSTIIGLVVGSSFVWGEAEHAWNHLYTGFLWVLIVSAGTGLARCVQEKVQRGEWWRGVAVGCEMSFPNTTMYMLAVFLASLGAADVATLADGASVMNRPDMLLVAPLFYAITLGIAFIIGPVYVLTSPFGVKHNV
jgi:hypothetical protein